MDNKNRKFSRQTSSKVCLTTEANRKSTEHQSNKVWPRSSHRRENSNTSKNEYRSGKQSVTGVRPILDKRPRQRGYGSADGGASRALPSGDDVAAASTAGLAVDNGALALSDLNSALGKNNYLDFELNSVYLSGSKKQNLNHLLNFHYAPRETDYGVGIFDRGGRSCPANIKKHKYNKEQFLQANFQFVITASARPKLSASPDTLIDWNLIEQINIHTTEEPQCPICLYPPVAAKMTRCGHAYCWPCILHYLALTDKPWRKCPICYEAIHSSDLKSTTVLQQQSITVGDRIELQLMRRQKGHTFIELHGCAKEQAQRSCYPEICSSVADRKLFSKFLIANRSDIKDIIDRENSELLKAGDSTCPEFVFIQQALNLLKKRFESLEALKLDNELESNDLMKSSTEFQDVLVNEKKNQEQDFNTRFKSESEMSEENAMTNFGKNSSNIKYYYFYQSADGQNIYLHPLNVKMLQACYGSLDQGPLLINACILQKDYYSMDEENRRKFTCLGHLPLTCQFAVVEVDLQPPLITEKIFKIYQDDILNRKKERQRRERDERKRERKIDEINDRQMGKLIASTTNINLNSSHEFPSCGFEATLFNNSEQDFNAKTDILPQHPRYVTYSSVAVVGSDSSNCELWPTLTGTNVVNSHEVSEIYKWGKSATSKLLGQSSERVSLDTGTDVDDAKSLAPMNTNLGDVLAIALSQKKQENSRSKKNKKSKKNQTLFSTGMNYNSK